MAVYVRAMQKKPQVSSACCASPGRNSERNGFRSLRCQTMIRAQTIHYVRLHFVNVQRGSIHTADEITTNDNSN